MDQINFQRSQDERIIIDDFTYDDSQVFDLIASGKTEGIFQLEK